MLSYKSIVTNSVYTQGIPSLLQYADSGSFFIHDITGNYDAANTGGWGAPNIAKTDVITFNLVMYNWTQNIVYYPTPPTTATINIVADYPISSPYEITRSIITGGQQTGNFDDGVYQIFGSTIVAGSPNTPLVTLSVNIQARSVVACMRKLSDKIAYGKPTCKEVKRYDLLTRTFNELINELDYQNAYLKTISLLDNNFSSLAFAKTVYERAVNLLNKCIGLCNEGGDCGC
jgi:hypothetical protein